MNKKVYVAPKVVKVKLEIKQAVLGSCNTTTNFTPGTYPLDPTNNCQITFCFSYQ